MLESLVNLLSKISTDTPRVKLTVPDETVRVLVVDDDTALREQVAMIVSGAEVKVSVAASTDEALQEIDRADILVLDWRLGDDQGRGGRTVLRQWKALRPEGPCVVVSAYMNDALHHELLQAGAFNAVSKPALDVLVRVVGRYVEQVRNRSRLSTLEANIYMLKTHIDALEARATRHQRWLWVSIAVMALLVGASDLSRLQNTIDIFSSIFK